MKKIYPEHIVKYAADVIKAVEESEKEMNEFDSELDYQLLEDEIKEAALEKFLDESENDIILTESEFVDCYKIAVANKAIAGLKEKGMVNTIEDENGEILAFLTEKGKNFFK